MIRVMKMKGTFGERLRALREDADLNQTELGKKLHLTQRKISYLECGKSEPSVGDLIAAARLFCVSTDYLLGLTGEKDGKR